ncbi:hypothetical protein CVIRNUC_001391 [Coccomyxa viridis]|uniref:Uncharacterized protein n=1 Tax=Coccomyxa viridis TaxID=1274662 RepID=A0AAV1HUP7_9CHLO|nr:hypothetical protein CVIRNUC_001391 [Coccomyxa viridis]
MQLRLLPQSTQRLNCVRPRSIELSRACPNVASRKSALQCRASFMIVFPALRALRFGQAYAAGKSFLQTGRPAKSDDSTPRAATATGGGSDDAGGIFGGGGNGPSKKELDEFGEDDDNMMSKAEAEELCNAKGVELPQDFAEVAMDSGLRTIVLEEYIRLQGKTFAGWLARTFPAYRDRLIEDPRFFFKIGAEIAIDVCCATIAEVRKRGEKFWGEFEFYLSDLAVGMVLDIVLVTLLAPVAVIGKYPKAVESTGLKRVLARVPSAVFAPSEHGHPRYRTIDRSLCIAVKFLEYSLAGLICGFAGQGFANGMMTIKRNINGASDNDVDIPSAKDTALTWAFFMGTSANVRYQLVYGLEHLVEVTVAKKIPAAAAATTLIARLANNVIGGENFIDMARWTGIQ